MARNYLIMHQMMISACLLMNEDNHDCHDDRTFFATYDSNSDVKSNAFSQYLLCWILLFLWFYVTRLCHVSYGSIY